ncbi:MAG: hypothetical protein HYS14_08900 [Candidatus Rokubacteria bacterium]|nr:hypothetical protein [Candidatus Rokubacteria bacterium]
MNFFCSVEHLKEWKANSPRPGRMVTLQEALALGPRLWEAMR